MKPDMAQSEALAQIPRETLYTWVMLWPQCDDFGHHRADPRLVWAAIYPLRNDADFSAVAHDLEVLEAAGLICRYTGCDGKTYLHVVNWPEHQRVDNASKVWLPLCSEHESERECRQHGASCGGSTEFSATRGGSRLGRRKTEDGRRTRKTEDIEPNGSHSAVGRADPLVAVFEAWKEATSRNGRTAFTESRRKLLGRWQAVYPPEVMLAAAAGVRWSPHHMGDNDQGTKYDSLELIFRDAKHVELFSGYELDPSTRPNPRTARERELAQKLTKTTPESLARVFKRPKFDPDPIAGEVLA